MDGVFDSLRLFSRSCHSIALAVLFGGLLVGCSEPTAEVPPSCAELVRTASYAAEVEVQIQRLDAAIAGCDDFDGLVDAMADYPGIVGVPNADFVANRCQRPPTASLRRSAVCVQAAPVTTTLVPGDAGPVYVADTYDGTRLEVTPEDVVFIGEVPAEIQETVDRADSSGCAGVMAQRDEWLARINDSREGQIASMIALHAERVAEYIGCDFAGATDDSGPPTETTTGTNTTIAEDEPTDQ